MNGREWRKEIFYSCSESFAKTKRVHGEKWKEIKIDQRQVKCIAAILKLPLFFHEPKFSAFIKLKQKTPPRFIYYSGSKFWFIFFASAGFLGFSCRVILGLLGFIYTPLLQIFWENSMGTRKQFQRKLSKVLCKANLKYDKKLRNSKVFLFYFIGEENSWGWKRFFLFRGAVSERCCFYAQYYNISNSEHSGFKA